MSSQPNAGSDSVFSNLFDKLKENEPIEGWSENIQLINGPSKWDLMIALLHGRSDKAELVEVQAEDQFVFPLRINSMIREDGSGENWILTGMSPIKSTGEEIEFSAFFSTRVRSGTIRFKRDK